MSQIVNETIKSLKKRIIAAIDIAKSEKALPEIDIPEFVIEVPANKNNGDFSTNVAMISAKAFKMAPSKIAELITQNLDLTGSLFDHFEIAGVGFINFFLSDRFYVDILNDVLEKGDNYGHSDFGKNKRVMVEFVSANPTGPMHMGNARGGALGDCLASVLEACGYDVHREFYVNDAGNQIDKFAMSLDIRYQQLFESGFNIALPEDSYHGEDIIDLAREFALINGDKYLNVDEKIRRKTLVNFALPKNIEKMKSDLTKYRIVYDEWFYESSLHKSGEITEVIKILKNRGLTYEADGALWYKAKNRGLEKDEVLVRRNGTFTYFIVDVAYHYNKFVKRKFDLCIDLLGADHHGHVQRMKNIMYDIGIDGSKLDVLLFQLVRLVKDNEVVKMSKRTGRAIQLSDLLDEVPVDAARFIFNMKEANSQMDFDLDMAKKQDSQNPVYYVQYAHARICSILRALKKDGITPRKCTIDELLALTSPEEKELIRYLSNYTNELIEAAKNYDPARITRYVVDLATYFHKFYTVCHVRSDNESLMMARLSLCIAVKTVIKNILTMFKISVPEIMASVDE